MRPAFLLALVLAAGCGTARAPEPAVFDLGAPGHAAPVRPALVLRAVDVTSPSWLDTPAMQYRLAYAQGQQRHSYAQARWAAAPRELMERALERSIASAETPLRSGGCKLRVDIDEFVQVFDAADASRGVIDARAALLAAHGDGLLARKRFAIARAAPSPDARGGAAALAGGAGELALALQVWLDGLEHNAKPQLAQACSGE